MKIDRMMTNHITEPIGFELEHPTFTWVARGARGSRRVACRIQIAKDQKMKEILFDSGKQENISPLGYCPDFQPDWATRYWWKVTEWDDTGDMGSGISWFETAEESLRGIWVGSEDFQNACFIKKFNFSGKPVSARLYITGLGLFEACLNGQKVGDEYLLPLYNDYNHWIQMITFDVTNYLRQGENVLSVFLGNGWYMGRFGFVDHLKHLYGDKQMLCFDLLIQTEDREYRISSDENMTCCESPFVKNSIYNGEIYDSRKEIGQITYLEGGEEGTLKKVRAYQGFTDLVRPRLSPYLRIKRRIEPVEIIDTPAGETVLDFGQELVGLLEFHCREKKGQEIFLQCGEILQEGNFYNDNLRTAREELRYIADGREKIYRTHFTFYGFRYLKVSGVSEVRLEDFAAYVLTSSMEDLGEIKTDHVKINRLIQNAKWGQMGNFLDVPTDCPQRDERMGWTGDAQVFCGTACFNSYAAAFYRKYMRDMLYEQRESWHEGEVPFVVPDVLGQINRLLASEGKEAVQGTTAGSTAWGDAAAVIPWTLYEFYGDQGLLREQYPNMVGWIEWLHHIDEEKCGGSHLLNSEFSFGDWLALDNYHQGSSFGGTDTTYISSAYYFYSTSLTAKAAGVLGYEEDVRQYQSRAEEIKKAIQAEFFTRTGRCACDTQTALVLALHFDLVPEEHRRRAIEDLERKIIDEDVHLTTGFVGTAYLCKTLSESGLDDLAYQLLLNEDYPSWLYEVNMGATTIWERWNSVLPDGTISDTGMNSLNHYAYGAIVEWIYRYMGGIQTDPKNPGFTHFYLSPRFNRTLGFCCVDYDSAMGKIHSEWKRTGKGFEYCFEVPFDTSATVRLADGKDKMFGPGRYHILAADVNCVE